jgi:DNA-binding response OmpR family regulator
MSRLCVVEDDESVLRLLGRTLRDSGFDVDLAASGMAAIAFTGAEHYDLVLLDLGLPDMDGLAILETLRSRDPDAQVMVVTAHDDCANRVRCLDLGACDIVGKPFDVPELLARVRASLRRRSHAEAACMVDGDIQLDLLRHRLLRPDGALPLPTREFDLLRYLLGRSGHVCSRQELLAEVWGYDFPVDTNLVDVYVSRLRAKLPSPRIETVRNVGYTLVAA